MNSKNINNIIAVLAILVVAVAVINLYITFTEVSDFNKKLTGYATGYVNITIASMIQINLTNSTVNFGAGAVNASCQSATLYTRGPSAEQVVLCGNWSTDGTPAHGIMIENTGNINCTLTAKGAAAASSWIGGTAGAGATYQWNFTVFELGSCSGGSLTQNVWNTANTSVAATLCTDFSSTDTGDVVLLDINLSIPSDATTGAVSDIITITAATQG